MKDLLLSAKPFAATISRAFSIIPLISTPFQWFRVFLTARIWIVKWGAFSQNKYNYKNSNHFPMTFLAPACAANILKIPVPHPTSSTILSLESVFSSSPLDSSRPKLFYFGIQCRREADPTTNDSEFEWR